MNTTGFEFPASKIQSCASFCQIKFLWQQNWYRNGSTPDW